MIKLKKVTINKYKCIETEQSFDAEDDITVLVGKNESGKTAILEAIHKSNSYLGERFDARFDFPRKEKKQFDKRRADVAAIRCTYCLSAELLSEIQEVIGEGTLASNQAIHVTSYHTAEGAFEQLTISTATFFDFKFKEHDIRDVGFKKKVLNARTTHDIQKLSGRSAGGKITSFLKEVKDFLQDESNIDAALSRYVIKTWIEPCLPKFLYYDEYFELPSEVKIPEIESTTATDNTLKTANALFELADININQLLIDNDYEGYKAELEATAVDITQKLFNYWKTNANLRVEFDIDRQRDNYNADIPVLKIRVFNNKYLMSLPLGSRSKGFNWFFSFLVWFSKIQEDNSNNYIVLLDEPGLNLHASAQADLLRFLEDLAHDTDLSENYQVIYTTHSPFMVDTKQLHRVRTVLETDNGTRVSDITNERDPDTLFPLQAALGYDITQNLLIGKNNLLVEGVSDLMYLQTMSVILVNKNKTGLRDDIAIVPVGGADKVATFIALMRGQELSLACLLDTFTEYPKKQKVDDLIDYRVTHQKSVRYFHEFTTNGANEADIEDMFERNEIVTLYNKALHHNLRVEDLDSSVDRIVEQIRKKHGKFNAHYQVAKTLAVREDNAEFISSATLDRFEKMFNVINGLFEE